MPIILIGFDPETKVLLARLLDVIEGHQQAEVDALTSTVTGLVDRLEVSEVALKSAISSEQQ